MADLAVDLETTLENLMEDEDLSTLLGDEDLNIDAAAQEYSAHGLGEPSADEDRVGVPVKKAPSGQVKVYETEIL